MNERYKIGDRVIVNLLTFYEVKEFGNFNEIIFKAKNDIKATITGYNYKRDYATIKFDDGFICGIYAKALIKISKDYKWVCNECNYPNFTSSVSDDEIEQELHACINCGSFEFHKKYLS